MAENQEQPENLSNIVREDTFQFVCFKLANEEYAVTITDIQEVIRVQDVTPLPQMPEFVLGVLNIRGNIISVVDLRKKLKLEACPFDNKTKIVVARIGEEMFGMVIDEILENITLGRSQINPAPAVKMKINRECVFGLGNLDQRMITIVNLEKVLEEINDELGVEAA